MTAAVVVLAIALAGALGAVAALSWAAITRADAAGLMAVDRAVAAGRAENAEAAVEASERLRQAERRRGDALEEELHAIDAEVSVPGAPGAPGGMRNRLLRSFREGLDAAAGDPTASGRGAAGELPDDATAEAAEGGDGPASVPE